MSGYQSLTPYEPDAYEVIAQAMAESERGRWFLDEHARRNRVSDTGTVLDAIARLESAVTSQRPPDDLAQLRGNLLDMANAISRTKAEIAAISAPNQDQSRLGSASEALDAIVRTTERATSDILGAAEAMQESAWLLRERGGEPEFCDRLDRHATQIYTACSFQDLTAQRTSRIVHTLRYLEDRLSSMIAIWDADGTRVPPAPGTGPTEAADLCQSDVDRFIDAEAVSAPAAALLGATALDDDLAFAEAPAEPEPESGAEGFSAMAIDPETVAMGDETAPDAMEPAEATAETSAQIEPDRVVGLDIEEPILAVEEPILEIAEPAAAVAEPVLEVAEPASEIAAEIDAVVAADAADRTPAEVTEPTRLDDIDLLSIEEKLALFS